VQEVFGFVKENLPERSEERMLLAGKGARGKAAGLAPPQHTVAPERYERSGHR